MPLFMQVRTVEGHLTAHEVTEALTGELAADGRFGVTCLRCWVSEPVGKVFCLLEADDLDLIAALRRRARRVIAEETYPVSEHARRFPATGPLGPQRSSPMHNETATGR